MEGRFRGLDELRRMLEERRREELDRLGMDGPLRHAEQRLAELLERERTALHFDAREDAAELNRQFLDDLPEGLASQMAALEPYQWTDRRAGAEYRALREELTQDLAEATFGQLAASLQQAGGASPEALQRMREAMQALNDLIESDARGEDTSEAFEEFRERYPEVAGDAESLEELLEQLARRMAAASRMLASLSRDQQAQLAQMARDAFGGDEALGAAAAQLVGALQGRFPGLGWGEAVPGAPPTGAQSGSMSQTVDWVEHLQSYEDLGRALGQRYPGARVQDVDPEELRRLLGEDAARDYRALREVERILEEAGAARRVQGRVELTPRGIRRLGERSLARIYERTMAGDAGSHRTPASGGQGELTGTTRPLRFGDPFRVHVGRTVQNALLRQAGGGVTSRTGVRLEAEDFELAEAEQRVRVSTVLLLDMSFSMPLRGNWVPAKRVALALQALVSSQFPEDRFEVIGFSDYARRLQPRDLLSSGWERVYGTNMQHAFMLARRQLAQSPGAEHQVIMVTDGEPTAHLEGEVPWFNWPPHPKTLRLTMAEASRLARTGATLNVFLLDHDPGAARFIEQMVSSFGGRIFYPDLANLGEVVVRDFLDRR
jgi:uncharacterized protein with von Willebrand factor type A (vWA) domain